ncbi:hypothetical protein K3495_g13348 [Podosphaera aphanis]|nr:hypothetical protein K3495_g13348 [Podosphaera aphanis]
MDKLQVYFDNLNDKLVLQDGSRLPVVRVFGHPFVKWGHASTKYLIDIELRQLHRWFGHSSVNCLVRTLERAGHQDPRHRSLLEKITKLYVFTDPLEILVYDAGTTFDGAESGQSAAALGNKIKQVPVKTAQSVCVVERYHAPLRRAYKIITDELKSQSVSKNIRWQLVVKAVNDSAGYDELVPTLLVFGTYHRLASIDIPSLSTAQRAKAIKLAITEVANLCAKRQVMDALRLRIGPQTNQIHSATVGLQVLVWHTHQKKQTGLFQLLFVEGYTC